MRSKINRSIAVAASALLLALMSQGAYANLVINGGFETGDFTGWTQFGITTDIGVICPGSGLVPEGNCEAFFGPVGSTGGISQAFSTGIGDVLHISFVFQNDNGSPGSFLAELISGSTTTLLSLTNPPGGGSGTYDFDRVAGAASSTLKFSFRDDPGFMLLDGVSVVPESVVPEPATLALLGLGLAGLGFSRRRKA